LAENNQGELEEFHHNHGEAPEPHGQTVLQLAYRVVAKFPHLSKRYQVFIGTTAVVSAALLVLTTLAIVNRMSKGQSAEQILEEITQEEILGSGKTKPKKPKNSEEHQRKRFLH